MATLGDWDKHFESLTNERLKQLHEALETLEGDEMMKKEFEWTGIFILRHSMNYIRDRRKEV